MHGKGSVALSFWSYHYFLIGSATFMPFTTGASSILVYTICDYLLFCKMNSKYGMQGALKIFFMENILSCKARSTALPTDYRAASYPQAV